VRRTGAGNALHALFRSSSPEKATPFDVDVLKVDVPGNATSVTPWRTTRQSRQPYYEMYRAANQPKDDALVDWTTM